MNKLEQDFLALKQVNDKLKAQLKDKEELLEDAMFCIIESLLPRKERDNLDKDLVDKIMKMRSIQVVSKYSKIDLDEPKKIAEFCNDFTVKYMKDEIKRKMVGDLGVFDD